MRIRARGDSGAKIDAVEIELLASGLARQMTEQYPARNLIERSLKRHNAEAGGVSRCRFGHTCRARRHPYSAARFQTRHNI